MAIYVPPIPAVIAAGQSLSGEVDIGSAYTLVGIWMPAAWTAASLTFQVSPDGGTTWLEHYNAAGIETIVTVAAGQYVALDPALWRGVSALKIRSGTSASPVNQVAQATLNLVTRTVT